MLHIQWGSTCVLLNVHEIDEDREGEGEGGREREGGERKGEEREREKYYSKVI